MPKAKYNIDKIKKVLAFVSFLSGAIFILFIYMHPDGRLINASIQKGILIFGYLCIATAAYTILSKKIPGLVVSLVLFCTLYFFIEVGYYIYVCFDVPQPKHNFFNKSCAKYDSLVGYKWHPSEKCRIVRIGGGEIIFDNTFATNNRGYISKYDYYFDKKDSSVVRFMVLGDSFTAGEYIETQWPDRINEKLAKDGLKNVELYSFGIDGGGLANWHAVFFNEIAPHYDFDGLIIASFRDDLNRDLLIYHMNDTSAFLGNRKETPPLKLEESQLLTELSEGYKIRDDKTIDQYIKTRNTTSFFKLKKISMYSLLALSSELSAWYYKNIVEKRFINNPENMGTWIELFFKNKIKRLDDIADYCKKNDKLLIIASVPAKTVAISPAANMGENEKTLHQLELKYLADQYNAEYFDSYPFFRALPDSTRQQYWLKYDGHWNQKGADLFAEEFYDYFKKNFLQGKQQN